ncbi:hypothetical protein [Negadavirga shengliensis]|uniref:DUF1349 domain-containing protein n=1 Tax=Negadavirga shengliensis TaxID=1389218 RepID=A0ABV9T958_9BACT
MKTHSIFPKFVAVLVCLLYGCNDNKIGIFDHSQDIGNPVLKGETHYDPETETYTLKGAGYNIWFARDEFHYLFKEVHGDFKLRAQMDFVGEGKDPHRKIGIMCRESRDEDAAHITATVHGDGLTVLQWREQKGMEMRDPEDEIFAPESHYQVLELERKGNEFVMRGARSENDPLVTIGAHTLPDVPSDALVGIFICSHDADTLEEARFFNLAME